MKNILIIGGNGFIGANLAAYLAEQGHYVNSFDIVEPSKKNKKVNYIQGDFFDDDMLRKIIADKDVIFHAISTINPGNSNEKYMSGYARDLVQTIKLCSWIIGTKTTLIFLSSGGTVYGKQMIQPITEDVLPQPINHYGNVKLCIENAIKVFDIQANSKMLIARISNPYGPGQDYTKGVGFIDAVLKKAINKELIEIWGDGEIVRDYIYINDVCKMLSVLMDYEGENRVFNISCNMGTTQKQILEIVSRYQQDLKCCYKEKRSVDVNKIVLDNSRIKEIYKEPIISIEKGIKLYFDYLMLNEQA